MILSRGVYLPPKHYLLHHAQQFIV